MARVITAVEVSALVTDMRLPAIQIYPGDWRRDNVAGCSANARCLWLEAMFVMHDAKPYGHLVENGGAIRPSALARRAGFSVGNCRKAFEELRDAGVPRQTGTDEYRGLLIGGFKSATDGIVTVDLSPLGVTGDGVYYSRRMVKDQRARVLRKLAGKYGGNPELVNHLLIDFSTTTRARPDGEDEDGLRPPSSEDGAEGTKRPLTGSQQAVADVEAALRETADVFLIPTATRIGVMIRDFGLSEVLAAIRDNGPPGKLDGKDGAYLYAILKNRKRNGHRVTSGNSGTTGSGRSGSSRGESTPPREAREPIVVTGRTPKL